MQFCIQNYRCKYVPTLSLTELKAKEEAKQKKKKWTNKSFSEKIKHARPVV